MPPPAKTAPPVHGSLQRRGKEDTNMHRDTSCQINALKETLGLLIFSFNVHCVEHYTVHTFYNDHMVAMYGNFSAV